MDSNQQETRRRTRGVVMDARKGAALSSLYNIYTTTANWNPPAKPEEAAKEPSPICQTLRSTSLSPHHLFPFCTWVDVDGHDEGHHSVISLLTKGTNSMVLQ
jgi:hypothetical protein